MKLYQIIQALEQLAPPALQESYDNSGLLVGNNKMEISGALICLDSIEEIIDEAIRKKCNLVIAHHPIVFKGLKSITGKNYIERTLLKAIKNDIAIYAIHTNLDNVQQGVNAKIGALLGIQHPEILQPKQQILEKLVPFCPVDQLETVRNGLFSAGAGTIGNYSECSFDAIGTGTFTPNENATPFVGVQNERHHEKEHKIEVIYENYRRSEVLAKLKECHPYESIAYDLFSVLNAHPNIGSGMFGELEQEQDLNAFFDLIKKQFHLNVIRHTSAVKSTVKKIAWCGGAGSFLLGSAKAVKADLFITGDFKYHEFFDHENSLVIADIGHYESEQFTIDLLGDFLKEKFPKFAVHLTEISTNPVNYY